MCVLQLILEGNIGEGNKVIKEEGIMGLIWLNLHHSPPTKPHTGRSLTAEAERKLIRKLLNFAPEEQIRISNPILMAYSICSSTPICSFNASGKPKPGISFSIWEISVVLFHLFTVKMCLYRHFLSRFCRGFCSQFSVSEGFSDKWGVSKNKPH